jgi:hypothetical protein
MGGPANPFTAFCQRAFDFLEDAGVRHLVIGGLAVGVIGEARTTGDVDVIGYVSISRPSIAATSRRPSRASAISPRTWNRGAGSSPCCEKPDYRHPDRPAFP